MEDNVMSIASQMIQQNSNEQNIRELDPLEVIYAAAEGIGLVLNRPKTNCKKCYGRGWIGRYSETGEPIACKCLFPKMNYNSSEIDIIPRNRKERRTRKK